MGNFEGGFWNLLIVVVTMGGIFALFVFTVRFSTGRAKQGETEESTGHVWDEDLRELNNPLPRWWVNMFYITLLFGAIYLILYPGLGSNDMLLGWTQIKEYEEQMREAEERYGPLFEAYRELPIEEVAADPEALEMGERLFATYCATCHGADAGGVRGFPNLRDAKWLWGGSPERIEETITNGRQGVMPPWQAALDDAGVQALTHHVLALAGREADPALADKGAEHYQQLCVACHGPQGKGNPQLGAPDLTNDVWLYGGSPGAIAQTIANGRNGVMPAHGEFLGEAKVHLLAAWVWSLSNR